MVDGLLSFANFGALLTLLSWPSLPCPSLVCPEVKEVIQTSPVLEKSLQLALTSLETCQSTTTVSCIPCAPSKDRILALWDQHSFLLGLVAGILVIVFVHLCYRAFRILVGSVLQSLGVPPATQPQRQLNLAAQVIEPANRNTLRALGLQQ